MKKTILFFALILALSIAKAQQVPNGGFENWTMKVTDNLDGYFTSNAMIPSDTGNVTKVTDSFHGLYAARLETVQIGNDTIQGMLLIGMPGGPQGISGGIPFIETPDSVSAYVKYDIQPNDTAFFIVAFKKNGMIITQPAARSFTGVQSTYTRFSVPTYLNAMNPPDSMVVIITSSNMNDPQIPGSVLTVDSISFISAVQDFPNNDFENWTTTISNVNPTGWSSLNSYSMYGLPELSFQTTDVNSGTYALRLISDTATLNPPFGTGALDTIAGYVFLGGLDMNNPGIPYTDHPVSMEAYVKGTFNIGSGVYLMAMLSRWNDTTQVRDEVGFAMYYTDSSMINYIYISVPFNYSLAVDPDTLDIKIMGGNVGPGGYILPGNEFFVDDISFSMPVSVDDLYNSISDINIYPNPTSGIVYIRDELIKEVEVLNIHGKVIYKGKSNILDLKNNPKGIYIIKVTTSKGIAFEKIVLE